MNLEAAMIESHAWESLVFKWDVENFTAKALAGRLSLIHI